MRIAVLAVLVASLLVPASAPAAPFVIGPGDLPAVAVDAAGTAHIAWNGPEGDAQPHYCRLPRGAVACDVALTLPVVPGTNTTARPVVNVTGSRVSVLVYRYGQQVGITRYTSTDGGVTFPTTHLAGGNISIYESVNGPGDTVSVVTEATTAGGLFQNIPLTGTAPPPPVATLDVFPRLYNGAIGLIDAATPLAIFTTGSSVGAFRRYVGGDLNTESSWAAPVDIGYVDYPRLAGGPSGLFLLSGDETNGLYVRKFDGTTFGPRVTLTTSGDDSEMSLFQDAAGRLHAVYNRGAADGFHAEHAVSDDGVTWRVGSIAVQTDDEPGKMRVAAAPDHVGVAAWSSRNATGLREIRVAAIGPDAPAAPVVQPPVPTPTPVADPAPEFHKTVVVRPVSGKVRVRLKGSTRFVDLTAIDDIPLGATIDAKRGRLELRSVPSRTAAAQSVQLYQGMFKVTQPGGITDFALNEPLAPCAKRGRAAAKKPKTRKLWGDGRGAFRTSGKYSAATVRGTRWLVTDSCSGTTTRVAQGSVSVRDKVKRRTVLVRAGRRYTARR